MVSASYSGAGSDPVWRYIVEKYGSKPPWEDVPRAECYNDRGWCYQFVAMRNRNAYHGFMPITSVIIRMPGEELP